MLDTCIYPVGCRDLHVDKDQCTRRSELCWSMLSTLLVWMPHCRCAPIKISLVNEVQCGTGTEWRDLIGQHLVNFSFTIVSEAPLSSSALMGTGFALPSDVLKRTNAIGRKSSVFCHLG